MKNVLVLLFVLVLGTNAYAQNRCFDIFALRNIPVQVVNPTDPLDLTEVAKAQDKARAELEKKDALSEQELRDTKVAAKTIEEHFSQFESQYKDFRTTRRYSRIFNIARIISGNSLESAVRIRRINLGNRFYRLMRAGDTVRATNYVRDLMSSVRSAAEIIFWAREEIQIIDAQLAAGKITEGKREKFLEWNKRLKAIVAKESKWLSRYGDVQMITYQLMRLKNMYNTKLEGHLREVVAEASMHIMTESVQASAGARQMIADTHSQMAKELGKDKLTEAELEKYINESISEVSSKMYGYSSLEGMFPDIFTGPKSKKVYEDAVTAAILRDVDFIGMVFSGRGIIEKQKMYGSELPLIASKKREIAWETLGAVRNWIAKTVTWYATFVKWVDRNNTNAISEALTKLQMNGGAYKTYMERFMSFSTITRQALDIFTRDIAIYDAIHVQAQRIDIIEGLLIKHKQGFETRSNFIESLASMMAGAEGKDFAKSFARIVEYSNRLNDIIEILRVHAEEVAKQYPNNKNANANILNMKKELEDAQAAVANKTISELSLNAEPNFVTLFIKQTVTFTGATVTTLGGLIYTMSPQTFTAITQFFGVSLPM